MKKLKSIILFFLIISLLGSLQVFASDSQENWTNGSFTNNELNRSVQRVDNSSLNDRIYYLNTKVFLKEDGTAHVEQLWSVNNTEGTEWYVPLQGSKRNEVDNLKVSVEGQKFTTLDSWKIARSFEEKAYQCGISIESGYPEICFGKSKYGNVVYKVSYDLKNTIRKSKDGVTYLYTRFINDNMDPKPEDIEFSLNGENLDMKGIKAWGFGLESNIKINGKNFVAENINARTFDHATFLVQFEEPKFNTEYTDNRSFSTIKDIAFNGSDYTSENNKSFEIIFEIIFFIMKAIIICLQFFIPFVIIRQILRSIDAAKMSKLPINVDNIKIDDTYWYRDIPAEGRIDIMQYFINLKNKTLIDHNALFMSSYVLKWIKDKNLEPIDSGKKNKIALKILKKPVCKTMLEEVSWDILRKVAVDDVLSNNELRGYTNKNFYQIKKDISSALESAKLEAEFLGYIEAIGDTSKVDLSKDITKVRDYTVARYKEGSRISEKGFEEIRNVFGFKQFLKDFTIIDERSHREIDLWEEYLIIAALFNLADTVEKEFKKLVPNFKFGGQETYNGYSLSDVIVCSNSFGTSFASAYNSTIHSGGRSSGGGGSSSRGGGSSGFSGGGSGGGSR